MTTCMYKSVFVASVCVIGVMASTSVKSSAQSGIASVHPGGRTASGEHAHSQDMTAAHRSLPSERRCASPITGLAVPSWFGSTTEDPSSVGG